jgi:hypothetical protein
MVNSTTRRLTTHKHINLDGEELQVLILWQEGEGKEVIKKENRFSKTQEILVNRGNAYEFIGKRA